MPEAARITDLHACPKVEPGGAPHVGGPIFAGSANVIIGYLPAARVGDRMVCFPVGPTDSIKAGARTVLINNRDAARRTDPGSHISGDVIAQGCPTVLIGDTPQSFAMRAAAGDGTPFCEECDRKRRDREAAETGEDVDPEQPPDPETVTLADPGAAPGLQDPLTTSTSSREELAKQEGGDELDGVRKAARYAVAFQFYARHGGLPVKPAKIWSHIGGIVVAKPVEVVEVAGKTLYQRGFPGRGNGEYYAVDRATTPEQLGTSSIVGVEKDGARELVTRDWRTVSFDATPAQGLKSTAAPILDTWSIGASGGQPGQVIDCPGGGTQIMVPRPFHGSSKTEIAAR